MLLTLYKINSRYNKVRYNENKTVVPLKISGHNKKLNVFLFPL